MPNPFKIRNLGQLTSAIARVGTNLYQAPPDTIAGVNPRNWPTAEQPVQPIGPPGSQPLAFPFMTGQNLTFTPRYDEEIDAPELRSLSQYPLARICIENAKDQLCQLPWKIQLRAQPGESRVDVNQRRKVSHHGDPLIVALSNFLEYPDGRTDWSTWLRGVLDDMLVIDAASIEIRKRYNGQIAGFRHIPGDNIARYIDDSGDTPDPPSPAYAQLWNGAPRVQMDTTQLFYKPRNIVPRNTYSSYLYGFSPVEQVAQEIRIGMARLDFVWQYYKTGSIPNAIQVVPAKVSIDNIREAMQWMNSELSGNLEARRTWRMIQGFAEEGKTDQIIFPKEPVLADVFDDLHIRKICFAFGTSPQRLQRQMNRASAQSSQQSAEDEGIRPWMNWIIKSVMNPLLFMMTGNRDYEFDMELEHDADQLKATKIDDIRVSRGMTSINAVRRENGEDPDPDPAADQLAITTPTGRIPIGQLPPNLVQRGDPTPAPGISAPKPQKVNGAYYAQ